MGQIREGDQRALSIMTAELARRLEDLNHAHAKANERDALFMPRDIFYPTIDRLNEKIASLARLVYIGVGIVLVLDALLSAAWIVFRNH